MWYFKVTKLIFSKVIGKASVLGIGTNRKLNMKKLIS